MLTHSRRIPYKFVKNLYQAQLLQILKWLLASMLLGYNCLSLRATRGYSNQMKEIGSGQSNCMFSRDKLYVWKTTTTKMTNVVKQSFNYLPQSTQWPCLSSSLVGHNRLCVLQFSWESTAVIVRCEWLLSKGNISSLKCQQ